MKAKIRMAACVLSLIAAMILSFSSCDYYDDMLVNIVYDAPNEAGVISYQAGISFDKSAARLNKLEYQLEKIDQNQITVKFPESVKSEAGNEYPIKEFGGPTGTNAPLEYFTLVFHVGEGFDADQDISLTIDVGALPLDVGHWNDVEIHCHDVVSIVEVEKIRFISDQPLIYDLNVVEYDENHEHSYLLSYDKWYWIPKDSYQGGEIVNIKIEHPEEGITRKLRLSNIELKPISICDAYIEYEFVMPYSDTTLDMYDIKQ